MAILIRPSPDKSKQLVVFLIISCLSSETEARTCWKSMDMIIAIDAASSFSTESFEEAKAVVNKIVGDLKIGPSETQLSLIRIGGRGAEIIASFDQVNTLAEFYSALSLLSFDSPPGVGNLADGLRLVRERVLITARKQRASKAVLLVRDRRIPVAVSDADALRRLKSEAAATAAAGATIQAIGIGGLWNLDDLNALYGNEYLLFKSHLAAFNSSKALSNMVCRATCPYVGMTTPPQFPGVCYDGTRHVIKLANVRLDESDSQSLCRREIARIFTPCRDTGTRCNKVSRVVSPCDSNGKTDVKSSWEFFDFKLQRCVTKTQSETVDCKDSLRCSKQSADVELILDRSGSMVGSFQHVKKATSTIISGLNIGPDAVHVGIITFGDFARVFLALKDGTDSASVLRVVQTIPEPEYGISTYTNNALELARQEFKTNGRNHQVSRYVFVITDGESNWPSETVRQAGLLKSSSVTLYSIGVGKVLDFELKDLTAPDSDTNMYIVSNFSTLNAWATQFAKLICVQMTAPDPKLCDDNVFKQSVTRCYSNSHQVTRIEYKYDNRKECIKSAAVTQTKSCINVCRDPINGNEYPEGTTWTSFCHKFTCTSNSTASLTPVASYCLAADGSCQSPGAPPFKCRDEGGTVVENCTCSDQRGIPTLLVDTQ